MCITVAVVSRHGPSTPCGTPLCLVVPETHHLATFVACDCGLFNGRSRKFDRQSRTGFSFDGLKQNMLSRLKILTKVMQFQLRFYELARRMKTSFSFTFPTRFACFRRCWHHNVAINKQHANLWIICSSDDSVMTEFLSHAGVWRLTHHTYILVHACTKPSVEGGKKSRALLYPVCLLQTAAFHCSMWSVSICVITIASWWSLCLQRSSGSVSSQLLQSFEPVGADHADINLEES